jgi:hypothetical protein
MKKSIITLSLFCFASIVIAQSAKQFWSPVDENKIMRTGERVTIPKKYKTFELFGDNLKTSLWSAPDEKEVQLSESPVIIVLPMPDGTLQEFRVVNSPVMAPELAAQFPDMKTFNIMSLDAERASGKLDWTEMGFHAMIRKVSGDIYIDPYSHKNFSDYIVYNNADLVKEADQMMHCLGTIVPPDHESRKGDPSVNAACVGANLRTYRLAVACTGEYAVAATGVSTPTVAQALSCIVTTVNRVDGVYEKDLSVKMVLVPAETTIVYVNASTDPFTGNNNANVLINESQSVIDSKIGNTNYDVGHTFSTGGGGLSTLGGVCTTGQKASSITGSPSPTGDGYDIDYVAHEMGHDFGGNHTFRAVTGACSGNQNPGTMVEPGSGITIMAYAGICSPNDDSTHSIAYMHAISYDELVTYTNTGAGNSCPVNTATGNHAPVVTGSATYNIPKSTPFILTGSATDQDNDPLTYSWEETDNNSTGGNWNSGTKPYFRSYNPFVVPYRIFPKLSVLLTGTYTTTIGEYLPSTAQTLNFRLTVRDNKMGGGGVCFANSQAVITSAGPFSITYPNTTGITWASGSTQTITWNVNGTDVAPVSCANVNILYSKDGGYTFTTLMSNVPNSGTQQITAPTFSATVTTCRIKVESVGNIFFDINDKNFTITAGAVGVDNISSTNMAMQLYPNPANNQVSVNIYGLNRNEKTSLVVYDLLGNAIMKDILSGKDNYELSYDVSQFRQGIYFIEVSGSDKKAVSKLVKR